MYALCRIRFGRYFSQTHLVTLHRTKFSKLLQRFFPLLTDLNMVSTQGLKRLLLMATLSIKKDFKLKCFVPETGLMLSNTCVYISKSYKRKDVKKFSHQKLVKPAWKRMTYLTSQKIRFKTPFAQF
jgi:hypothetical protein